MIEWEVKLQNMQRHVVMCRAPYFQLLSKAVVDGSSFERRNTMSEDGLYLHKRHIRGDHGKMLEQAGTVLQHTVIYLKEAENVCTLPS